MCVIKTIDEQFLNFGSLSRIFTFLSSLLTGLLLNSPLLASHIKSSDYFLYKII